MSTTRRLKIKRYASEHVLSDNYGAYRIRVVVEEALGPDIDKNIFIFRRNPTSPHSLLNDDTFEAVAGPPQLVDIPAGEPHPDQSWPYFRQDNVELDFASSLQAEEVWQEIQREIGVLLQAMDRLDRLQVVEEYWVPSAPDESQSSSASSSASSST